MANHRQDLRDSMIWQWQQADEDTKRLVMERYEQELFPNPGSSIAQTKWTTYHNLVRVTLWGRDHFCNNVCLARVLEALNLGP